MKPIVKSNKLANVAYDIRGPVLDKARAASKEYFNKNENYRTFGRAVEWFSATGWPDLAGARGSSAGHAR